MVVSASPTSARDFSQHETKVLRQYYLENDIFLSMEGILKVVSIVSDFTTPLLRLPNYFLMHSIAR